MITVEETERLLAIVEDDSNYLVLYPASAGIGGFNIGFQVFSFDMQLPGVMPDYNRELFLIEKQLPEGYRWDRMAKIFMKPRNVELVDLLGLRPIEDKVSYEY